MEYKIGSFNMYKLSYQKDKEISKNYGILADMILTERFDILALQEVFNEGAIKMLVNRLGAEWDYVWAQPLSKSVQAQEGYAFIWNKRRFRIATGMKKSEIEMDASTRDWRANKTFDPRIHNNYRSDRTVWHQKLNSTLKKLMNMMNISGEIKITSVKSVGMFLLLSMIPVHTMRTGY